MMDMPSQSPIALTGAHRGTGLMQQSQAALNGAKGEDALRRAAEAFEGLVLGQLLAPMVNTVPTDGPFGGGSAESMYRSFMVDEIGKTVARAGGIGIADSVYAQFAKMQEV